MKKFYLLIALLLSVNIAGAYIESGEMATEQFLKDEGFSSEAYRIIHLKTNPQEAALEKEEKKNKTNKFLYYLKKGYVYLDPYADNENFGVNDIKYQPTFDDI